MTVEIFTLCQCATVAHGSISMLQTFENWNSPSSPVDVHGVIALKVRFDQFEEGQQVLSLKLVDPDGASLWEFTFEIEVVLQDTRSYQYTLLHPLGMQLPFGHYSLCVLRKGQLALSIPFYVLEQSS